MQFHLKPPGHDGPFLVTDRGVTSKDEGRITFGHVNWMTSAAAMCRMAKKRSGTVGFLLSHSRGRASRQQSSARRRRLVSSRHRLAPAAGQARRRLANCDTAASCRRPFFLPRSLAFYGGGAKDPRQDPKRFGTSGRARGSVISVDCEENPVAIRALVWGENVHEQINKIVGDNYPKGMHERIAEQLRAGHQHHRLDRDAAAARARPDRGQLKETDVLLWWGHAAHGEVAGRDRRAGRQAGLGRHGADRPPLRAFLQDLQAPDGLALRPELARGRRARAASGWSIPGHPIAAGLPQYFELEMEEMYGEPFTVPEPLETVFIAWFQGGEVFRSGLTYRRGAGNIFYFQPGPRDLSDLSRRERRQGAAQCGQLGLQPDGRRRSTSTLRRTGRSTRCWKRSPSAGRSCTSAGEEGFR